MNEVSEPTLEERLEFLTQSWERDIESMHKRLEVNDHPENYVSNKAWMHSKEAALRQLKLVLKEGDW